jgi:hypothetical protein
MTHLSLSNTQEGYAGFSGTKVEAQINKRLRSTRLENSELEEDCLRISVEWVTMRLHVEMTAKGNATRPALYEARDFDTLREDFERRGK